MSNKYQNKVRVVGTLTGDTKHGVSQRNTQYCAFSLEVAHERGSTRHSFVAFGPMCGEIERAEAGDGWVQVTGALSNKKNQQGSWELKVWVDEAIALGGADAPSEAFNPTDNNDDIAF